MPLVLLLFGGFVLPIVTMLTMWQMSIAMVMSITIMLTITMALLRDLWFQRITSSWRTLKESVTCRGRAHEAGTCELEKNYE